MTRTIEGERGPMGDARFAIVASRFNQQISDRLLEGCLDAFRKNEIPEEHVTVVWVPGALEIPVTAQCLLETLEYSALIGVGCVVRGETGHYEHVANGASNGLAQVALQTGIPVLNSVLTTDTLDQALERSGGKVGNKGFDAASAAIQMASLFQKLPTEPSQ